MVGVAGLQSGQEWIGTEFSRYASGAPLDAMRDPKTGALRGYLRNRHHSARKPVFPSVGYRTSLTEAQLEPLRLHRIDCGPWLQCSWAGSRSDPSGAWLFKLLPEGCLVVQLGEGRDAGDVSGGDAALRSALVEALQSDTCLIAPAVTFKAVVAEAYKYAPWLRDGGAWWAAWRGATVRGQDEWVQRTSQLRPRLTPNCVRLSSASRQAVAERRR